MKIAVGISGGVDSAVAAFICKEQGHEVIGVTMKIWDERMAQMAHKRSAPLRDACFGPEEKKSIEDAEHVCKDLGIPLHVIDCSDEFHSGIIGYFSETYLSGQTPNPCVYCNQKLKFGLLPELLFKQVPDIDLLATGHYARVIHGPDQVHLLRSADLKKDQSYFLYRLSHRQLSKVIFPIGHLTKAEVRKIAASANLHVCAKPESQDFYSGDYRDLIRQRNGRDVQGEIVDVNGVRLGVHNGIWNFTVGQRKGLGVCSPNPLYVIEIDRQTNTVIVGPRQNLAKSKIIVDDFNRLETFPDEVSCKIRSSSSLYRCKTEFLSSSALSATFSSSVTGVSPGQSAVFYHDDLVLGGGIIGI